MTAHDLFEAGNIPEAIKAASGEVKKHPLDAGKRMVLCELLCFAGELDKADRELETLSTLEPQDPEALVQVNWMRQLIRGETARQEFHTKGRLPDFLSDEVTPDLRQHLEASVLLRDGKIAEGAALLAAAEEKRPKVRGTCNGQAFDDLRDLDDLMSSFLEVLTSTGKYFWIPLDRIESIELPAPARMRDLLWRRAHMVVRAGPDGEVYLPVLYAGAATDANAEVRLGRTTEWRGESPVRGAGQKMLLVGEEAMSILEIATLTTEAADVPA